MRKILQYFLILTLFTPLCLNLRLFQPYVTSEYFYFLAFILLSLPIIFYFLPQYKILWKNKYFLVIVLFFWGQFFVNLFSVDYIRSFWGDWQRMDALLYYIFYLFFFLALILAFRYKTAWYKLFFVQQLVLLASLIWAWGQKFSFWFFADEQASRVYALIGNANFFAHYLLLSFYLSLYLLFSHQKYRYFYLFLAIFNIPVIYWTQSRAAWLALLLSLGFLACYYIWYLWQNKNWQILKIFVLSLFCIFSILFFISDARHKEISLDDTTVETRIVAWRAGFFGFLDQPIFGWGRNNYQIVFNKYLDNKIYKGPGTPMWFDKAHNQYIDYLVEGGLLGLIIYLAFLVWPFLLIKKIYPHNNKIVFLGAGLIANIIFLFFNFDTITSYLLYFIYLAYLYYLSFGKELDANRINKKYIWVSFVLGFVVAIYLAYYLYYLPLQSNLLNKKIQIQNNSVAQMIDLSKQALFLAPQYLSDINFALASAASRNTWELTDKQTLLLYLASFASKNSQQHVLDAKSHFLTANTYLELGALSANKDLIDKALAYYQDIMPRLTLSDRSDVQEKIQQAQNILKLLENNN